MKKKTWQQAQKILCIRLDYLGDVLMCTPAIRALKEFSSERHITLLTSASGASAARMVPEIDAVLEYSAPWMKNSATHQSSNDLKMIDILRSHAFDAAVIFTTYSQNPLPASLICYLSDIPLRLGYCHENPYQLLTDWIRDPEPQQFIRHEVQRQLDLVQEIGCVTGNQRLSFRIPPDDNEWAKKRLQSAGVKPGSPWILMHPGATAASRRYPPELWRAVAQGLSSRLQCPLVFTGGSQEITLIESIRRDLPAETQSLAGELDLGKLGAVISQAPVMIANNTGPAHIAAAVGTPIVDLYALTNPQHTPWQVPNRVLYHLVACRNCYKSVCPHGHNACLTQIRPERVIGAAIELLEEQIDENAPLMNSPISRQEIYPLLPHAGRHRYNKSMQGSL
jgi:lipopolysaccharide heptosyltransferase II